MLRRQYEGICDAETGDGERVVVLPGRLNGRKVVTTIYPSLPKNEFLVLMIAYENFTVLPELRGARVRRGASRQERGRGRSPARGKPWPQRRGKLPWPQAPLST